MARTYALSGSDLCSYQYRYVCCYACKHHGCFEKRAEQAKIRCACLGAVFYLPMSTITIVEDALMIDISAVMLATLV
jgi:hypothetical protein